MNILNKGSEVLLKLDLGDITLKDIKNMSLTYYTSESNKVECNLTNGKIFMCNGELCSKLETEDTTNFTGVLYCDYVIEYNNDCFSDGGQLLKMTNYLLIKFN